MADKNPGILPKGPRDSRQAGNPAKAGGSGGLVPQQEHEELQRLFAQVKRVKDEWTMAMDVVSDLVLLIDEAGNVQRCNKAVSDLFCPVAGEVLEINSALGNDPATVNSDPYGAGWMLKLRISNESELDALLGAKEHEAHIGK